MLRNDFAKLTARARRFARQFSERRRRRERYPARGCSSRWPAQNLTKRETSDQRVKFPMFYSQTRSIPDPSNGVFGTLLSSILVSL